MRRHHAVERGQDHQPQVALLHGRGEQVQLAGESAQGRDPCKGESAKVNARASTGSRRARPSQSSSRCHAGGTARRRARTRTTTETRAEQENSRYTSSMIASAGRSSAGAAHAPPSAVDGAEGGRTVWPRIRSCSVISPCSSDSGRAEAEETSKPNHAHDQTLSRIIFGNGADRRRRMPAGERCRHRQKPGKISRSATSAASAARNHVPKVRV